jgi:signal peptidase II
VSRPAWIWFCAGALAVLVLDQATKAVATARLEPRGSIAIVPGLFDLTYVRNQGAVFGLFRDLGSPWRSVLLTLVPAAAIAFVLGMARRTDDADRIGRAALALVLGGAVGNLIDRLRFGSVVDFLDFHVRGHHWPAFNAADSAICVGIALLILDMSRPATSRAASE